MNLDQLDNEVRALRVILIIAFTLAGSVAVKTNGVRWTVVVVVVSGAIALSWEFLKIARSRRG